MAGKVRKRVRNQWRSLRMAAPIALLTSGVLGPVVLIWAAGVVALVLGKATHEMVIGLIVVSLGVAATAAAIVVAVLLGRRSRVARLQSDLLGNVSHELKTPIAGIKLSAQTLLLPEAAGNAEIVNHCANAIVREAEWLHNMVETMLTWRSAMRDREDLQLERSSISTALTEAHQRFMTMLPPEGALVDFKMETSLPVQHDPRAVVSIVVNLLTNAYKYSKDPKRIALSSYDVSDGVEISVSDNGLGVAPDEVEKIFQPFYRVDNGLGARASGAGLGLAIVSHLVAAMGGKVKVVSQAGQGSTFVVWLPAS